MKIIKMNSLVTPNIRNWLGKLYADEKYLHGFWEDEDYYHYHYVKYDTNESVVVETYEIEKSELNFEYDSIYHNNKMYCIGKNARNDKIELRCFDMETCEASLIADYDMRVDSHSGRIYCSLQEEDGKIRCEIRFSSKIGKVDESIEEYF